MHRDPGCALGYGAPRSQALPPNVGSGVQAFVVLGGRTRTRTKVNLFREDGAHDDEDGRTAAAPNAIGHAPSAAA
jgi:hypothetical protein